MIYAFTAFSRYNDSQKRNFSSGQFSAIKKIRRDNMRGTNHPAYGTKRTDEQRQKISKANLGRKVSSEGRERIRQSIIGRKASDETKAKLSALNSGVNNNFYGKKHSIETKEILRQKSIGNKNSVGRIISDEMKAKLSKFSGEKHHAFGKTKSDKVRKNMSEAQKGRPQQKITCPHCGLHGGISALKGYHFDKCKLKPLD